MCTPSRNVAIASGSCITAQRAGARTSSCSSVSAHASARSTAARRSPSGSSGRGRLHGVERAGDRDRAGHPPAVDAHHRHRPAAVAEQREHGAVRAVGHVDAPVGEGLVAQHQLRGERGMGAGDADQPDHVSTAIAALWPGMPLTPPPRRAPAPHSSTLRVGGLDAPAARGVVVLRVGPRQVAVEDVAAGQRQLGLELERRARLQARLAVGRAPQAVLDRLGQHGVQRAQRGRDRRLLRAGRPRTGAPGAAARSRSASARRPPAARGPGSSGRSASGSRPRTAPGPGSRAGGGRRVRGGQLRSRSR